MPVYPGARRIVGIPDKCCRFVDGGWPGTSWVRKESCPWLSRRPNLFQRDRVSKFRTVGFREELEHAIGFFADAVTGELSLPVQWLVPTINSMNRARHRPTGRNALGTARRDRERYINVQTVRRPRNQRVPLSRRTTRQKSVQRNRPFSIRVEHKFKGLYI
jgi:hypothetical protein